MRERQTDIQTYIQTETDRERQIEEERKRYQHKGKWLHLQRASILLGVGRVRRVESTCLLEMD